MSDSQRPPPSSMETQMVEVDPLATRRHGALTVASGLEAGKLLPIKVGETALLGRSPECTFPFDDTSLSREHCGSPSRFRPQIARFSLFALRYRKCRRCCRLSSLKENTMTFVVLAFRR